jgi:hypothetical protein
MSEDKKIRNVYPVMDYLIFSSVALYYYEVHTTASAFSLHLIILIDLANNCVFMTSCN